LQLTAKKINSSIIAVSNAISDGYMILLISDTRWQDKKVVLSCFYTIGVFSKTSRMLRLAGLYGRQGFLFSVNMQLTVERLEWLNIVLLI